MLTENRSSNTEQMISVPVSKLKKIHRDLNACQKVIWLRGGFDPAYCKDAQDSLKDIDALLIQSPEQVAPFPGYPPVPEDRKLPAAQHQGEPGSKYPNRLCHLDYTAHPYRCGCLKGVEEAQKIYDDHCRSGEVERLRAALKFYADRDHFSEDMGGDWDNVSGEPANILWHADEAWFVEDGSIARAALSASTEPAPTSNGFSAEQMTAQGADGYRSGIKAAAELAEAYPELAQAIRDLPLPQ